MELSVSTASARCSAVPHWASVRWMIPARRKLVGAAPDSRRRLRAWLDTADGVSWAELSTDVGVVVTLEVGQGPVAPEGEELVQVAVAAASLR